VLVARVLRFSNDYGSIEEDPELRVILHRRSAVPFPTEEEIRVCFAEMSRELDRVGRRDKALLVDLRDTQGINDPRFEEAVARGRKKVVAGFVAIAALVKTAAGALQLRRQAAQDGAGMRVFQDEAEAIAYLAAAAAAVPRAAPSTPPSGSRR
jgi:hypothetical protein